MKKSFSIVSIFSVCFALQAMEKKQLTSAQKFQLYQDHYTTVFAFDSFKECENQEDKKNHDYLKNNDEKVMPVSPYHSWSFNPLAFLGYFFSSKSGKKFDWENPYIISGSQQAQLRTGYKNFIEYGKGQVQLHDINSRKIVHEALSNVNVVPPTRIDKNSCFWFYYGNENSYEVKIYDAQQGKAFSKTTKTLRDRVYEFGSNDLRFFNTLTDETGDYVEVSSIRGNAVSEKIRFKDYTIKTHHVFNGCLLVIYQKEDEHVVIFYDIQRAFRKYHEFTTKEDVRIISGFWHLIEDRIALQCGSEIQIYSTKGDRMYKATSGVKNSLIDWDNDRSRFVLFHYTSKDCAECELHIISRNTVIPLRHEKGCRFIAYKGFSQNYFYAYAFKEDSSVLLYHLKDGSLIKNFKQHLIKAGFSRNGALFYLWNRGHFLVYDSERNRELVSLDRDDFEIFPRNNHLCVLRLDKRTLYACNLDTLQEQKKECDTEIFSTAFGTNDDYRAIALDKKIDIFDATFKNPIHTIKIDGTPTTIGYSPDGRWLVVFIEQEPKNLYVYDCHNTYSVKKLEFKDALKNVDVQSQQGPVIFDEQSSIMMVPTQGQVVTFTTQELSNT